jgi:prepilin-type N-terminal cleavage/methylation domain-containing protein
MRNSKLSSRVVLGRSLPKGFTLVELMVTIVIVVILASLSFSGYQKIMKKAGMAKTMSNMRQLASGTVLYTQDHNGYIPRGDEGADGGGKGGRGIIWINHIADYIGNPELEEQPLNKSVDGMDQWTYMMTRYEDALFVCGGFDKDEEAQAKRTTPDAIGGIGYNVKPLSSERDKGPTNASWGSVSSPIRLARITHQSDRCMYASSYDWHLVSTGTRAYNRFGKDKAAMVFWDGSCRTVSKEEYDRAINSPEKH